MMFSINQLLPQTLQTASADIYRQATLIVYAVVLSSATVLLTLLLLCWLGFESTAMNAAWLLPLQPLPILVLWLTSRPVIAGHAFMVLLLGAIVWDFGPDNGLGVMAVLAFAVASWALVGRIGGTIWTGVGVIWAGVLGPFVFRGDDYSPALSVTTAVITLATGIAAGINEITRVRALRAANQALEELQHQRDSMRTFVEVAFSSWIETRGGEIVRISDAALRFIGVASETLTGRRLRDLVHPDDWPKSLQLFREARAPGFRTEMRVHHEDGAWIWIEVFGVPLVADASPDLRPRWIFGVRDIAEERRSREQLIRAQKLESVGQLAAGIAHDFNNLLTVINGFAELLPASDSRAHILRAGRDAAKLTADIMAFARTSPVGAGSVDLSAQVDKWRSVFESLLGERTRLILDLCRAPAARISEAQLNQILLNLVSNARDALPEGGEVTIRVFDQEATQELCEKRHLPAGEYVCFEVCDTGVGMTEDVLERAFDPFFTTKGAGQGTGLGLASVYGIVHQQGGWVEITSTRGRGTEVLVILPQQDEKTTSEFSLASGQTRFRGTAKVLLLEDNPMVGNLVSQALRKAGYHVDVCRTRAEARAIYQTTPCDLLITDVVLVEELGTDFVLEVRQQNPELPVLLISGYTDIETSRWRDSVDGRSGFLAKPFSVEGLLREVRYLLPEPSVTSMLLDTHTPSTAHPTNDLQLPKNPA